MHNPNPIILIVGTRPEGIKMAPVYFSLKKAGFNVLLCSTGQHNELLSDVLTIFGIKPDINLDIMRQGQDLFYTTQSILQKCKEFFLHAKPQLVLVQGDTTSTMAATLAAFYLKIPVGHIEAGLRTDDIYAPFPEEVNRRLVSSMATYHFAPTPFACAHLLKQGILSETIFCTGNTIVDSLRYIQQKIALGHIIVTSNIKNHLLASQKLNQKIILLTLHRRESFGQDMLNCLTAVKEFLQNNPDVFCFYPYHPNPYVIEAIARIHLSELDNIYLTEPLPYQDLVAILSQSTLVVTDSGGIQEEAVSLGKYTIILREKTERPDGIWAGIAFLAGTDQKKIKNFLVENVHKPPREESHIFGDGHAAEKISTILSHVIHNKQTTHTPSSYSSSIEKKIYEKKDCVMKKVCVVGIGYIGLPTAIIAAENQLEVIGFDIDEDRVKKINEGNPVIEEPEVFERLQLVLHNTFKASTIMEYADYYVIAVPTPFYEDKKADLSYVFDAAARIAPYITHNTVIILESTVPIGTTKRLAHFLEEATHLKAGIDFFVSHCPERVLPGKIFHELAHNSRIIGGINKESIEKTVSFYRHFVKGELYLADSISAEMIKLVENSSRDVQIAFAHQIASMSASLGLDPYNIIELANKHPRVNILNPTAGVGGHCIAVDPWFLIESFPQHSSLLHAARIVNEQRPHEIIQIIRKEVHDFKALHQRICKVLVLGLTYKPNIDDMRESPALFIAQQLQQLSTVDLLVCEPHINKSVLTQLFGSSIVNLQEGIIAADIIVYLVAHSRFKAIDEKFTKTKKQFDFCGILHKEKNSTNETREYMFWPAREDVDTSVSDSISPLFHTEL